MTVGIKFFKNELFVPNGMFASVIDNFRFYFLLVIDNLAKRILIAEGVHIFEKSGFLNFDFKSTVFIYVF